MDYLFRINLQLTFGKIVSVLGLQLVDVLKMGVLNLLGFLIWNHFCVVSLLACNFQCVFLADSNFTDVLVCLCIVFYSTFSFY